jgi:hypothetical protein
MPELDGNAIEDRGDEVGFAVAVHVEGRHRGPPAR